KQPVLVLVLDGQAPVVDARRLPVIRSHVVEEAVEVVKAGIERRRSLEGGRRLDAPLIPVERLIDAIGGLGKAAVKAVRAPATSVTQCLVKDAETAADDGLLTHTVSKARARADVVKIRRVGPVVSGARGAHAHEDQSAGKI